MSSMMLSILSCLFIFLFSLMLTWLTRLYVIRKAIFDIPNERSSHQVPTPRGGGLAIVLSFSCALIGLAWSSIISSELCWALLGGGTLVAAIGYGDDIRGIPARWRFFCHFLAATWAVFWLGGFPILDIGIAKITLHFTGFLLAIIGIVWCINFYNFMDGIDGLASSEGMFISMTSGLALWWLGMPQAAIIMWLFAAAIAGFTVWNWPPAKIFLGDVGSGYLGFMLGTFGLYTVNQLFLPVMFWWVIFAVFFWDATFTLLYRMWQGKKWYHAHREHAYQQLIANGMSHCYTTLAIVSINIFFLLPLAIATLYWPTQALWLLSSSIVCLGIVWAWVKFA